MPPHPIPKVYAPRQRSRRPIRVVRQPRKETPQPPHRNAHAQRHRKQDRPSATAPRPSSLPASTAIHPPSKPADNRLPPGCSTCDQCSPSAEPAPAVPAPAPPPAPPPPPPQSPPTAAHRSARPPAAPAESCTRQSPPHIPPPQTPDAARDGKAQSTCSQCSRTPPLDIPAPQNHPLIPNSASTRCRYPPNPNRLRTLRKKGGRGPPAHSATNIERHLSTPQRKVYDRKGHGDPDPTQIPLKKPQLRLA